MLTKIRESLTITYLSLDLSMYVVQKDVVDTVIGPPEYIEQVFNEDPQDTQEGQSRLPRKDHD